MVHAKGASDSVMLAAPGVASERDDLWCEEEEPEAPLEFAESDIRGNLHVRGISVGMRDDAAFFVTRQSRRWPEPWTLTTLVRCL